MNTAKTCEDTSYWERACHFFYSSGSVDSEGSYFIHNKDSKTVKIGIMCQSRVYIDDESCNSIKDGKRVAASLQSDDPISRRVETLLKKDAPCFFIVSPDINRRFVDKSLPTVVFVQPGLEFTFSSDQGYGEISYAQDSDREQQGSLLLRESLKKPVSSQQNCFGEPMAFSEMAANWIPAEEDDNFLKRLDNAITILRDFPNGKMTLTRSYEHPLAAKYNPFKLYELHARLNGEYACSHFVCIRKDVFSLGCSPENIFEICDDKLVVDVVAATCKSSNSDEYLAKELCDDPKQIKEHRLSLNRRMNRFSSFCKDGSVSLVSKMQIKQLRNVCHLHSVVNGELLPHITIFDLLESIVFPLLGSYPKELIPVADTEMGPHRYYGGLIGHAHSKSGGCFLNIRNALLKDNVIYAKVGVGVVKESTPYRELLETRDKISGLMEAIHLWEQCFHANEDLKVAASRHGRNKFRDF